MAKIKLAASVILSRGPVEDPEVYLGLRAPELKFFGGYWVFPGGNLDPDLDAAGEDEAQALVHCAVRELLEEVNLLSSTLGGAFSNAEKQQLKTLIKEQPQKWREFMAGRAGSFPNVDPILRITTPPFVPVQFDTQFLHVRMDEDEEPRVDDYELIDGVFIKPGEAVRAWESGDMEIAPPVLYQLRLIARHGLVDFREHTREESRQLKAGKLHEAWFSPGIFLAPLRTPTLPPATTTNTLVVGTDDLYIIDPATPDTDEQQRLFRHMDERIEEGKSFKAILLTHHHADHIGGVNVLSQRYQLPVRAHRECYPRLPDGYIAGEPLADGDRLALGTAPDGSEDWYLEVLHTPGHAVDHLCFLDSRYQGAIIGDMLSTLSTIVIDPPEGHMRTYLEQLQRLLALPIRTLFPSHGPPVRDGKALLKKFLAHRKQREQEVINSLDKTPRSIDELLPRVYDDVPASVYPIASRSLLAGLIKLEEDGIAMQADEGWCLA